jgi:hypothetical protein
MRNPHIVVTIGRQRGEGTPDEVVLPPRSHEVILFGGVYEVVPPQL